MLLLWTTDVYYPTDDYSLFAICCSLFAVAVCCYYSLLLFAVAIRRSLLRLNYQILRCYFCYCRHLILIYGVTAMDGNAYYPPDDYSHFFVCSNSYSLLYLFISFNVLFRSKHISKFLSHIWRVHVGISSPNRTRPSKYIFQQQDASA